MWRYLNVNFMIEHWSDVVERLDKKMYINEMNNETNEGSAIILFVCKISAVENYREMGTKKVK